MKKTAAVLLLAASLLAVPSLAQANSGDFDGGVAIGTGYAGVDAAPTNGLLVQGNVAIGNTSPGAPLDVGSAGTTTGTVRLEGGSSGYVQIQPASAAGSWTLTLPTTAGTNSYVLQTDGSGNTSWVANGGGGSSYDVYADANTQLLLHMENNAADSSIFGYSMTNSGVTYSNSIFKLGSYSAFFNGTSSSGDTLVSTTNIVPSPTMEVDLWAYFTGNVPYKGSNTIYGEVLFSLGTNGFTDIMVNSGATSGVPNHILVAWGTSSTAINQAYAFSLNTWYHIAFEAIGNNGYLWVNGSPVASTGSNIAEPAAAPINIGFLNLSGYEHYMLGYIDEVRVSNAVRYQPGVSFTPPTAPYNPGPIQ